MVFIDRSTDSAAAAGRGAEHGQRSVDGSVSQGRLATAVAEDERTDERLCWG
jgi:hypothetical protein